MKTAVSPFFTAILAKLQHQFGILQTALAVKEDAMKLPAPLNLLDQDHIRVLEPHIKPVEFSAESLIFEIDSPGDSCYIIDEGTVRLEVPPEGSNPDDHEHILNYIGKGTILGELALLDRLPRSATAYAHTDVKAYRLDGDALDDLAETHPQVTGAVYAALGQAASLKLRAITDRLAGFIFKSHNPMVEDMVERAQAAQLEFVNWSEERVDVLLQALAQAVYDHTEELATLNVEETSIGNVPDKITKIQIGSLGVYESLAGDTGYGLSPASETNRVADIVSPFGIVVGLVPVTNPVSTFIFKVLICLKGRNAAILCPSRRALETSNRVGAIVQDVLKAHDAPLNIVQWVQENHSVKTTSDFMKHEGVSFVLATGGPRMVKAAYSSGTPAIGVGPGNAPALVCADAEISQAVQRIVDSKSFDNGVVCCSEHNLVVDARVRQAFVEALEQAGTAILTPEEAAAFTAQIVDTEKNHFKLSVVGQTAANIAEQTGIQRDYPIKLIVVPTENVDPDDVYSREKLAPILSLFTVENEEDGLSYCQELLAIDGTGHTAIIYTQDPALMERFGLEMPASRILVNAPGVQGGIGAVTGLAPSLTLGCGTFGGSSTTDNVTFRNLLNVKRLAYYAPDQGALENLGQ
jgi:acyl-CoA reductase-like NAD-dependent aldehyde dehydrogenase